MHKYKGKDLLMPVTKKNVRDGIANDQNNCTFGQCALSREKSMAFFVDPDPLNPVIWAEWNEKTDKGYYEHHKAEVVLDGVDRGKGIAAAIAVVSGTDLAKKSLLKRIPEEGMVFRLVNHVFTKETVRNRGLSTPRLGETDEDRKARLATRYARNEELKTLRAAGMADPPKKRHHRVRARFGQPYTA